MRNFARYNVDTRGKSSGVVKTVCQKCQSTRHNKRDRSLQVNVDTGHCHCFHCGVRFIVPDDEEERERTERMAARQRRAEAVPQHFRRPVFDASRTTLSDAMERWLVETRCIPQSVIARLRITDQEEFMPQSGTKERCVCFNYFEGDQLINTKFRSGAKHFKMVQGAELIPYNIDSVQGHTSCIIHEGELDAASSLAAGFESVISVPAGANANLSWLDRFMETHFEDLKEIIIAVDTDTAGIRLRDELVNRFGAERCRVVTYGPGCKDANEHLVKYGVESLRIAIEQAAEVPLEGIFTATDLHGDLHALFENGFDRGAETGWEAMDKICTYERRRNVYVTGIPGSGKSEWVDELVLRLCLRHQWKIGFFSPENVPIVYHYRKLIEKLTGHRFHSDEGGMSEEMLARAEGFLAENVSHIALKGNATPDRVMAKAHELVVRRGCRIFVFDPLNRFDHVPLPGQTETQYLSNLLNRFTEFATQNNCLLIVVAHPRKMNRNPATGVTPRVEMYDINGSADFYNKADYGIVVVRDKEVGVTRVHVDKVKFKHLGGGGVASFVYDLASGRFYPCEESDDQSLPKDQRVRNTVFDTSCWLKNKNLFGEEEGEE